jgi:rare lipoprotein A (peptidoglycan hydrolase)
VIGRGVARRVLVLAAIALLGGVLAFAASSWAGEDEPRRTTREVQQVPVPGSDWYRSLAAPYPPSSRRERTACGHPLGPQTLGVAHPVLPCGVKIFIAYRDKLVLTQVVDRGPAVPGRDFDITPALARRLGLTGTQQIRWRYAR